MREYSLAEFAVKLVELQSAEVLALHHGLKRVAELVEKTAKAEIGHYQRTNMGPFPAWEELKASTKAGRVRNNYTENDPGFRSGAMQASIGNQVHGLDAEIGSNDQRMVYFELGTNKQAPRPVLGLAAFRSMKNIERIIGHAAVTGLLAGTGINPALGYDFDF